MYVTGGVPLLNEPSYINGLSPPPQILYIPWIRLWSLATPNAKVSKENYTLELH